MKTAPKKKTSPRRGKRSEAKVQITRSEWEALRIRSRTLGALGMGAGMPCPKCSDCLMVKDACPGCGHKHVIEE